MQNIFYKFSPKILTSDPCVGVHQINDNAINALKQKHPKLLPILEKNPPQRSC